MPPGSVLAKVVLSAGALIGPKRRKKNKNNSMHQYEKIKAAELNLLKEPHRSGHLEEVEEKHCSCFQSCSSCHPSSLYSTSGLEKKRKNFKDLNKVNFQGEKNALLLSDLGFPVVFRRSRHC